MAVDLEHEEEMKYLIKVLNDARSKYYPGKHESSLSDAEYDEKKNRLHDLEEYTGIRLPNSPTDAVGYGEPECKYPHEFPILSLQDTKEIDEMLRFLGEEDGILSWKLDGLSLILTYMNGRLEYALTRGDGHCGKDVTRNVRMMQNVPDEIMTKQKIVIRGEGVISIENFKEIKDTTPTGQDYKNPRNMAAGVINRNYPSILLGKLAFIPHSVVYLEEAEHRIQTRHKHLEYLQVLGFETVPFHMVHNFDLKSMIENFTERIEEYEYPVDGLVLALDNIDVGEARGTTAHHPKHSLAFKWPDMTALTRVTGVKWSMSKNGLLTPVVIFEPVELEGTTVRHANLHNVKRFKDLGIGVGDIIKVYKANKIIPEVEENYTRSKTETYPMFCPKCNAATFLFATDKTEKLFCWNCRESEKNSSE